MPTFFNFNKRKGVFMIPAGATKSPTPAPPSFSNTKSLAFDGVDEYTIASLDGTGGSGSQFGLGSDLEFTISFWFYRNSSSTRLGLFQWANTLTALSPLILIQQTNDSLRAYYDGAYRTNITTSQNVWYHIAMKRTASDNTLRGYLNGSEWFAYDDGGTPSNQSFATNIYFGNGYQNYFNGNIDELSIYNTALSDADISTIATAPSDLSSYNPVAWYRNGDGDTFPTITDNGSGGNNGTMINMEAGDIDNNVPT